MATTKTGTSQWLLGLQGTALVQFPHKIPGATLHYKTNLHYFITQLAFQLIRNTGVLQQRYKLKSSPALIKYQKYKIYNNK